MKITKEQIKQGLDKAYKEVGSKVYLENGFELGIEFALNLVNNGTTVKSREVCSNSEHKPAHSTTTFCSICQCVAYLPEQTE